MAVLQQAFKLLGELGLFSKVESVVVPDEIFAFSMILLACSEEGERACDVDGPWR